MIATTKTGQRTQRVLNILHSINEDISKSGALKLVGEGSARGAPSGLQQGMGRTTLYLLDEAAKKKRRKKLSPEEMEKRAAKWEEGRAERDRKKDAANAAKRKKARAKSFERKRGRAPDEDELASLEKQPKFIQQKAKAAGEKIAKRAGKKDQKFSRPGRTPGGRWEMPQPKYGEFPKKHRDAQDKKKKDLDWLEKERQRRSAGERGTHGHKFVGPLHRGQRRDRKAGIVGKAGKLTRLRYKNPKSRDREHDKAKGYDPDEKDVHSSGKEGNKKFANATTFRDSDDDAMLHTDKSKSGSRGSADGSEFVFKGDTEKDPRQKWYRVSKQGGYASAMASLGKAYHKSPDMRNKVISKVKSTGFVDGSGHQIDIKPTGALHNERGACTKRGSGKLTTLGKALKKRNPSEFYRLCKGAHGISGTKAGRSEYGTKSAGGDFKPKSFDPRHDDAAKLHRLHKAAERGKADKPSANIAQHREARPVRRKSIEGAGRSIDRWVTGPKS